MKLLYKTKTLMVILTLALLQACSSYEHPDDFNTQFKPGDRNFDGISVNEVTRAPLQVIVRAQFEASPKQVFSRMGDHKNLGEWIPFLDHEIQVDNRHSITPGQNDVGTVRICLFGDKNLTEDIKHWVPGKGYSYSARNTPNSPMKNHLGVITIEEDGKGGSLITWRQYFEPSGFKGKHIMPAMMTYMLDKALDNLSEEFGGYTI